MELEDLKGKIDVSKISYSRAEIESIFELRTKKTVRSINKKMLIDALLMITTTVVLVAITFSLGLRSRYIISIQILSLALLLLAHYRIKYLLLNKLDLHSHSVTEVIQVTFKTIRRYWIGYHVVIPLLFSSLTWYLISGIAKHQDSLVTLMISSAIGILTLGITNVLVRKIYQGDYQQLKKNYEQFQLAED